MFCCQIAQFCLFVCMCCCCLVFLCVFFLCVCFFFNKIGFSMIFFWFVCMCFVFFFFLVVFYFMWGFFIGIIDFSLNFSVVCLLIQVVVSAVPCLGHMKQRKHRGLIIMSVKVSLWKMITVIATCKQEKDQELKTLCYSQTNVQSCCFKGRECFSDEGQSPC